MPIEIEETRDVDTNEARDIVHNMIMGIDSLIGLHMRDVLPSQKWLIFGRVINYFFSRQYGSALTYMHLQSEFTEEPFPQDSGDAGRGGGDV